MKISYHDFKGFTLENGAESLGTVADCYFDDQSWEIEYLVIETGGWFSSHKVLLRTTQIATLELEERRILTTLSRTDVQASPEAQSQPPVSAQMKAGWHLPPGSGTYLLAAYGLMAPPLLLEPRPMAPDREPVPADGRSDDKSAHLRSANELIGYGISATDDDLGSLADLLIDPECWKISFLAVDSGDWLPGKLVVIAPAWISEISWHARQIRVPMSREKIQNSPPLSSLSDLQKSYENDIHAYYGYPIM